MEQGSRPRVGSNTPLHEAARQGEGEMVDWLLDYSRRAGHTTLNVNETNDQVRPQPSRRARVFLRDTR